MASLDTSKFEQLPKYQPDQKVEYSDLSPWEEVEILDIIEVFPFYQHIYKIKFKDGYTMHTTDEALRELDG